MMRSPQRELRVLQNERNAISVLQLWWMYDHGDLQQEDGTWEGRTLLILLAAGCVDCNHVFVGYPNKER